MCKDKLDFSVINNHKCADSPIEFGIVESGGDEHKIVLNILSQRSFIF